MAVGYSNHLAKHFVSCFYLQGVIQNALHKTSGSARQALQQEATFRQNYKSNQDRAKQYINNNKRFKATFDFLLLLLKP